MTVPVKRSVRFNPDVIKLCLRQAPSGKSRYGARRDINERAEARRADVIDVRRSVNVTSMGRRMHVTVNTASSSQARRVHTRGYFLLLDGMRICRCKRQIKLNARETKIAHNIRLELRCNADVKACV